MQMNNHFPHVLQIGAFSPATGSLYNLYAKRQQQQQQQQTQSTPDEVQPDSSVAAYPTADIQSNNFLEYGDIWVQYNEMACNPASGISIYDFIGDSDSSSSSGAIGGNSKQRAAIVSWNEKQWYPTVTDAYEGFFVHAGGRTSVVNTSLIAEPSGVEHGVC
jgi:hypothetical protein